MTQNNIEYHFAPQEGFESFNFERGIKTINGWHFSEVTVYCKSAEEFRALLNHWNSESWLTRSYKALQ